MPLGNMTIERRGRELYAQRTFDAPLDLVWRAWTEADRLKEWWGPRAFPTTYCTVDFRVGGVWHYCMTGPNGEESWGKSTYREIVDRRRIAYLDQFCDKDGNVAPGMPEWEVTVEFEERDGKTIVTSRATVANEEDLIKLMDMGVVQGFTETWDKLEEYLAANR